MVFRKKASARAVVPTPAARTVLDERAQPEENVPVAAAAPGSSAASEVPPEENAPAAESATGSSPASKGAAPDLATIVRSTPLLRQGSSNDSLVRPEETPASGERISALKLMKRRWHAAAKEEPTAMERNRRSKRRRQQEGCGTDGMACLLTCCLITAAVIAYAIFVLGALFGGVLYAQNMTFKDAYTDFERQRAATLQRGGTAQAHREL